MRDLIIVGDKCLPFTDREEVHGEVHFVNRGINYGNVFKVI